MTNTADMTVYKRHGSRCKRGILGQVALNDPAQNPHLGNALNDPHFRETSALNDPQLKENLPSP